MKKRIFSMLTALTLIMGLMPVSFASEDTTTEDTTTEEVTQNQYVTIRNEDQLTLDPYTQTSVGDCYSYFDSNSALALVEKTAGVSTNNGRNPAYLVFKGVDFGELGAASVSLEYAHKYARTGSITFYTATANADGTYTAGTTIATLTGFEKTGSYYADATLTKTVDITADINGTHDIMVKFASGTNKCPNLVSFTFTEYDPFGDDTELNFVYLGGSITQGAGASDASATSWRALTGAYLSEKFAKEGRTINHYNAAIGGTGSDFGLSISLEEKVMAKNPDMVFIEYAVNDLSKQDGLWQMESIVKTLNNMENPPYIMFIYTTTGSLNSSSAYHNKVAEHYGIPTVDLQAIIKADIKDDGYIGDAANGDTNWGADMTADNIHPNDDGYAYFTKYINEALAKGSAYKKPATPETQVSEFSRIVDIEKVPVTDYVVSGTEGTDWEIKEVSGKNLLYLYTPGTTVTATIKGDLVGFEDYIHRTGGSYSVAIDGRVLQTEPRDTYNSVYTAGGPKINMGYFNMKMPWKDERTVTLTMLEDKNSNVSGDPVVVIGTLSYNNVNTPALPVAQTGVNPYDGILATNENVVLESNQSISNSMIGNLKAGEAFSVKNINFNKGTSKVVLEYASNNTVADSGQLDLYLGTSASGTKIASIPFTVNGSWTTTTTVEVDTLVNAYGTYTLYCKTKGGVANLNVKSITFTDGTGLASSVDATLNYNYAAETSGATLYNGVYDDLGTGDYLKFVVDFGDAHTKDLMELTAAAKDSEGSIVIREGSVDGEIIATVDASQYTSWASYKTALEPLTDYAKALTGEHDVYVTFEGEEGFCVVKSIGFGEALDVDEIVFDTTNYSGKGGDTSQFSINSTASCFQGFNKEQYVYWENVDFGSVSKLRNVTVGYGLNGNGSMGNCYVTVRLDSPSGKIIAQDIMKWESGITWTAAKYLETPVIQEITGIHKIYVSVEYDDADGYRVGTRGGNIFSLDFAPAEGNYLTKYDTYGDHAHTNYAKDPVDIKTVLTFLKDADTPENVAFVTAIYNSENQLIGVDYKTKAVTDGVNSLTTTLDYSLIAENDTYNVKGFVWDSETINPVTNVYDLATIDNTVAEEATE